MIDKLVAFTSVVCLLVLTVNAAPTADGPNNSSVENIPETEQKSSEMSPPDENLNSTEQSMAFAPSIMNVNDSESQEKIATSVAPPIEKARLQATPSSASNLKSRKNKNDLFFCCSEDYLEPVTESAKRGKERERNTKPPVLKRGKDPDSEEPFFERRPALLLRFFPDGTAVLISKFQLHLHVKPKQIKFESEETTTPEDVVEFNPGLILNNGKSYEVTYKRLEAIPASREQSLYDMREMEDSEDLPLYKEESDHRDHEFVTTSSNSTVREDPKSNSNRPLPFEESTTSPAVTAPRTDVTKPLANVNESPKSNKSDKVVTPTVGDSPFFIMTSEEMSSLQQQYEPVHASPFKGTTAIFNEKRKASKIVEDTTQMTSTSTTSQTSVETTQPESIVSTEATTSTTRCLSFRNQLSLVLSTEDNIDNSLLKRHILPTEDCNNSEPQELNSLARIQSTESTVTESTSTITKQPIISNTAETTTQAPYTRHSLVPYLSSQLSNNPSRPDVVVVTSLPVLIDLKSTRNQPVTDVPAWREVTVGVVRDQQGQPLKPRYNNWTAHLRGLRKKPENKFWNDFTTPKTDSRQHSRAPIQQTFQPSSSQINRSFWTDMQRHQRMPDQMHRSKDVMNSQSQPYLTNPPRNYPAPSANEFQFWRNKAQENRWNANNNVPALHSPSDYSRNKGPLRNPQRSFENQESQHQQHWNNGNLRQNGRRW